MRLKASVHFKLTNPNKAMSVVTDKRSKRESVDSGKVAVYRHTAIIYGAVFKVAPDAQRRIAAGGPKSVHAQVWGTIESSPGRIRPTEPMQSHGAALTVEVHYNPRRAGFFHYFDDAGAMVPVYSAPMVGFSTAANGQGRCWIAPTR